MSRPRSGSASLSTRFTSVSTAAESCGTDATETIERVGTRLEAIQTICPFVVTFADSAGLHAEFTRNLTERDANEIESVYPIDDAMEVGL